MPPAANRFFADYEPSISGRSTWLRLPGLVIKRARPRDTDAVARILWERSGGNLEEYAQRFLERVSGPGSRLRLDLIAVLDAEVVGHAEAASFAPPAGAPANAAPAGWYLSGVNVPEPFRRRGIATALTRRRLSWIAERASEAYYFANAANRASIDLHAALGFLEVTRDFWFPGVTFRGGVGILFRLEFGRSARSR